SHRMIEAQLVAVAQRRRVVRERAVQADDALLVRLHADPRERVGHGRAVGELERHVLAARRQVTPHLAEKLHPHAHAASSAGILADGWPGSAGSRPRATRKPLLTGPLLRKGERYQSRCYRGYEASRVSGRRPRWDRSWRECAQFTPVV